MLLILFNLSFWFLAATNFFPSQVEITKGQQINEVNVTQKAYLFNVFIKSGKTMGLATVVGMIFGALASFYTRSLAPMGIGIFTGVFWGSFITASTTLSTLLAGAGFHLLFIIFMVVASFIFVASIIEMATGVRVSD